MTTETTDVLHIPKALKYNSNNLRNKSNIKI